MTTAIQNVRIFNGDQKLIENGSILFDENGVLEVTEGQLAGDINIDGSGKTVTPGLMDSHVHLGADQAPDVKTDVALMAYQVHKLFSYGITTVRNAFNANNTDVFLRDLISSGKIEGCRIVAAGRGFSITGGGAEGSYEVDTPDEMRKMVRRQIKCNSDFIKLGATGGMTGKRSVPGAPLLNEEMMRVAVEEARRTGRFVMVHATNESNETAQSAARAGVRSIEHVQMNEETARLMKENGVYYCPTIATRYLIVHNTRPEFMYMTNKAKPGDLDRKKAAIQLCLKHGVPIAAGSDANDNHGLVKIGTSFQTELQIYVEYGMTPMQVLQSATKIAAEMMAIDEEVGTLKPGKAADIAVFNGNPLKNIKDIEKVSMTFHNGKMVYQA